MPCCCDSGADEVKLIHQIRRATLKINCVTTSKASRDFLCACQPLVGLAGFLNPLVNEFAGISSTFGGLKWSQSFSFVSFQSFFFFFMEKCSQRSKPNDAELEHPALVPLVSISHSGQPTVQHSCTAT